MSEPEGSGGSASLGKHLALWMILISAVCAVWFIFIYDHSGKKEDLNVEIAKTLLEVGVVTVAGALLRGVAAEHGRRAQELRYREELLKDAARRVTTSYNKAKKARRNLRALARNRSVEPTRIILVNYDKYMAEVNDAQLELEMIKRDVEADIESNGDTYPSISTRCALS